MSSWNDIQSEIEQTNSPAKFDIIRRKKLKELADYTGRDTIIYATDFLNSQKSKLPNIDLGIDLTDKDGFIEVMDSLDNTNLDVVIHSPGGIAEATESIVHILRSKFTNIRFIIPSIAKSAATMLAMSGDEIVMDERSELGPTDPQMQFVRDGNLIRSPAHAIKEQFKVAQDEIIKNPQKLSPWLPILRQYGPSLLSECDMTLGLSKKLVAEWLKTYMFSGSRNPGKKASVIANYLRSHSHLTHSRRIGIEELTKKGLKIVDTRNDQQLRDKIWDLYLSLMFTFSGTGAYKIFENQKGKALIRQVMVIPAGNPQNGNH